MSKVRIVTYTEQFVAKALGLPDDCTIVGSRVPFSGSEAIEFKVASDRFGDIKEGDAIPMVSPEALVE